MKSYSSVRVRESEVGTKFGRLTVAGPWFVIPDQRGRRHKVAVLDCDCGKSTTARRQDLRSGQQQSCGCRAAEITAARNRANTKHGQSRRYTTNGLKRETPEYNCWAGMIQRCENPKHTSYYRYGGRGIRVCDRWRNSFEAFFEDMGPRPSDDHSIDRIDVSGNYEPENCRWLTTVEQERNKSTNKLVTANGETKTVVEWSEATGIPAATIYKRIDKGMPPQAAVTKPVNQEMSRRSRKKQ